MRRITRSGVGTQTEFRLAWPICGGASAAGACAASGAAPSASAVQAIASVSVLERWREFPIGSLLWPGQTAGLGPSSRNFGRQG
jgi:hypothetical protein